MESRYEAMQEARGFKALEVRMFGHPTGRLGRIGGRMMLRRSGPGYEWITGLLAPGPEDVFLDVGCGAGGLLAAVQRLAGEVVGVDPSQEMATLAAQTGAEVHTASAGKLPLADGRFSVATAMHTVDLWESPADGLAEIARVVSPQGRLAVVVRRLNADAKRWDPARAGCSNEGAVELADAMGRAGFRDVTRHDARPGVEDLITLVGVRES